MHSRDGRARSSPGCCAELSGAGLGLRRSMLREFETPGERWPDFLEIAPENWIGVGGRHGKALRRIVAGYPLLLHGLSLDIGGHAAIDVEHVRNIGKLKRELGALCYTEHLSYCADDGHLYDLLPIPFTEEAVHHVARRVRQVQDILGERIALENSSYYAAPWQRMSELEFIKSVLDEADCGLLLDVNNIFVNSINHRYDALDFLRGLPGERSFYIHIAGHYVEAEDLRVDTHGAAVIDPVWELLAEAYRCFGPLPTLVERDFNIPPLAVLMEEVERVRDIQARVAMELPARAGTGR